MSNPFVISLVNIKQVPHGFAISDHFIGRWNERVKSDWDRFCYRLNQLYVMCIDTKKLKHCLYYDPPTNKWYVFFIGPNNMLVTILTEEIYATQLNAVRLSPNKESYFRSSFASGSLLPMHEKFQLVVEYETSSKNHTCTYTCTWGRIFSDLKCIDPYYIKNYFEVFCEFLVSNRFFITWVTEHVKLRNIKTATLVINKQTQEIDFSY